MGLPTIDLSQFTIYCGVPTYDTQATFHTVQACHFPDGTKAMPDSVNSSLLCKTFNELWARALTGRRLHGFTHFIMCHADVVPEPRFKSKLLEEIERLGADMVSAVVPIKDHRGLTSTAIDLGETRRRRLTMTEVYALPETFNFADVNRAFYMPEARGLLLNTGCWIADLRKPWVEKMFFRQQDWIEYDAHENSATIQTIPEDWDWSRRLNDLGCSLYATRKVMLQHRGDMNYDNSRPWGSLATDTGTDNV